jgi:hypothetical protein
MMGDRLRYEARWPRSLLGRGFEAILSIISHPETDGRAKTFAGRGDYSVDSLVDDHSRWGRHGVDTNDNSSTALLQRLIGLVGPAPPSCNLSGEGKGPGEQRDEQ